MSEHLPCVDSFSSGTVTGLVASRGVLWGAGNIRLQLVSFREGTSSQPSSRYSSFLPVLPSKVERVQLSWGPQGKAKCKSLLWVFKALSIYLFWYKVSYSLGWLRTHYLAKAGLGHPPPLSPLDSTNIVGLWMYFQEVSLKLVKMMILLGKWALLFICLTFSYIVVIRIREFLIL